MARKGGETSSEGDSRAYGRAPLRPRFRPRSRFFYSLRACECFKALLLVAHLALPNADPSRPHLPESADPSPPFEPSVDSGCSPNDNGRGCAEGLDPSAGSLRVSLRNHIPLYFGVGPNRRTHGGLPPPQILLFAQNDNGGPHPSAEGPAIPTSCHSASVGFVCPGSD